MDEWEEEEEEEEVVFIVERITNRVANYECQYEGGYGGLVKIGLVVRVESAPEDLPLEQKEGEEEEKKEWPKKRRTG